MNAYFIYKFEMSRMPLFNFFRFRFFKFLVVFKLGVTIFLKECINIESNNCRYDIYTVKKLLIKKYEKHI